MIFDGNSVLHRAYYALPDWRNRSGEATAGVYGFLSMMVKIIDEYEPTHVVVVFDTPEPTFRHLMYVGYQSTREKDRQVSEDIWGQVEKLKLVMESMGVPVFCVPGFEADDLAGTLTLQAEKAGMDVLVVTGDKDYMQLVTDKVKLLMPQKSLSDGVVIDETKVKEKMGVKPNQITDYKGLVGDPSDNYPGVTGIGPKTAVQLLTEFETFEEVYKHLNDPKLKISELIKAKLVNGYEGGRLSKELAIIKRDVPITFDLEAAVRPTDKKISEVFKEAGYRSLTRRVEEKENAKIKENQKSLFD